MIMQTLTLSDMSTGKQPGQGKDLKVYLMKKEDSEEVKTEY